MSNICTQKAEGAPYKIIKWAQQSNKLPRSEQSSIIQCQKRRGCIEWAVQSKLEHKEYKEKHRIRGRDYRTGSELLLNSVHSPQCKCRLILWFVWLWQFSVIMLSETVKLNRATIKRTEKQMQKHLPTLFRINWLYNHLNCYSGKVDLKESERMLPINPNSISWQNENIIEHKNDQNTFCSHVKNHMVQNIPNTLNLRLI